MTMESFFHNFGVTDNSFDVHYVLDRGSRLPGIVEKFDKCSLINCFSQNCKSLLVYRSDTGIEEGKNSWLSGRNWFKNSKTMLGNQIL